MIPTLLDTKTGERRIATDFDASLFWWSEGNGSCDCNRALVFGDEADADLQNDLRLEDGICFGSTRFIAIDVTGDLEGMTKEHALADINEGYPPELITKLPK